MASTSPRVSRGARDRHEEVLPRSSGYQRVTVAPEAVEERQAAEHDRFRRAGRQRRELPAVGEQVPVRQDDAARLPRAPAREDERGLGRASPPGQPENLRDPLVRQDPGCEEPGQDRSGTACGRDLLPEVDRRLGPGERGELLAHRRRGQDRPDPGLPQARLGGGTARREVQVDRNLARAGDGQVGDRRPRPGGEDDADPLLGHRRGDPPGERGRHGQKPAPAQDPPIPGPVDDRDPAGPPRERPDDLPAEVPAEDRPLAQRVGPEAEERPAGLRRASRTPGRSGARRPQRPASASAAATSRGTCPRRTRRPSPRARRSRRARPGPGPSGPGSRTRASVRGAGRAWRSAPRETRRRPRRPRAPGAPAGSPGSGSPARSVSRLPAGRPPGRTTGYPDPRSRRTAAAGGRPVEGGRRPRTTGDWRSGRRRPGSGRLRRRPASPGRAPRRRPVPGARANRGRWSGAGTWPRIHSGGRAGRIRRPAASAARTAPKATKAPVGASPSRAVRARKPAPASMER